jgi:hypothetical protein
MIRRDNSMRTLFSIIAAAMAMSVIGLSGAHASEVCVTCVAPAQTYRCTVVGDGAPADPRRLGLYCAYRIAQDEAHASCASVRKQTQCEGLQRQYGFDEAAAPKNFLVVEPDETADTASEQKQNDGPPRTVVEFTRETARQTTEGVKTATQETVETTRNLGQQVQHSVKGAAEAVDGAARATWRCVGSWFDDC